jgi:hypothetical protein
MAAFISATNDYQMAGYILDDNEEAVSEPKRW